VDAAPRAANPPQGETALVESRRKVVTGRPARAAATDRA